MNAAAWARQVLREFTSEAAAHTGGVAFRGDVPPGVHPNACGTLPKLAVKAGAVRVVGVAKSTKPSRRNGLQLRYEAGAPKDVARFHDSLAALDEQDARQLELELNA